jgi:hypothetical protein
MARHIERRAAQHFAARQDIPQRFAQADDREYVTHREFQFSLWARPRNRIAANLNQGLPLQNPLNVVESEQLHSHGTHFGQWLDRGRFGVESEMIVPPVGTRVKQAYELLCSGHNRSNVAPFGSIADGAGKRQIIELG